ncbi:SURF1 family protein [Nocardioides sp. cx-169]|uniref:SURF1 family cytochrome oxidase biogenesis protein n=1 Tax=Nocardioides sp. cx-169 TaxID=2899080 RepID=UPI001E380DEE|nr:SURF1 family protein [Nocardioides sp. cx-169]MCD4535238.1 SURF1 family protein [Nocardioides sp. cx-169]
MSRRWALFAAAIVVVASATWWLGQWQFDRLADRKERNEVVRANEGGAPTPVDEVLEPGGDVAEDHEWLIVTATGTYDTDDTVIVRYRTRDGRSGIDVVVPLVTSSGTALLVDRGWMPTANQGDAALDDVPAPPSGEVTVTGWVRADGTGSSTAVTDRSTRAINSKAIGEALGRDVYGGFVELQSEDPAPAPATSLEQVELPELDNGPHFFYGLQWWFFGVLAIFGFFYLMYDEWRGSRRGRGSGAVASREPKPVKQGRVRQSNHPYVLAQRARDAENDDSHQIDT